MVKFRWSVDGKVTWTTDDQTLPFNLAGVTALDDIFVEPLGEVVVTDVLSTIVSASKRTQVNYSAGQSSNATIIYWRNVDKTPVSGSGLFMEFWNGYVDAVTTNSATEKGTGNVLPIRGAFLVGTSGTGGNQSSSTLIPVTWAKAAAGTAGYIFKLDGTAASSSDFTAASGVISGDNQTITIPNGWYVKSDEAPGTTLSAGQNFMWHFEVQNQGPTLNRAYPTSHYYQSRLGDMRGFLTSGSNDKIYDKNWSSGAAAFNGGGAGPVAIGMTNAQGKRCVATAGSSIMANNHDSPVGSTTITGDDDGALHYGNRAINLAGYSWVRTAVPGIRAYNSYVYGGYAIRELMLKQFGVKAVLSDMGMNDRGLAFAGAAPNGWLALHRWYWGRLRTAMGPGGRIVGLSMFPQTSSTDSFATTANQTSLVGPGTPQYDSINPFFEAGVFNVGAGDPDAAYPLNTRLYDLASANGMTDVDSGRIKWPTNGQGGSTNGTVVDGSHPKGVIAAYIAADLAPHLPTLFGFSA